MSGYAHIHRSLLGHPAFRTDAEAMAFAWMVLRASWRPARVRYKGHAVQLGRGELAISQRDMADALDRDKSWIERLWKRLAAEAMVTVRREAGSAVITICNYDKYQASADVREAEPQARPEADARQAQGTEQRREEYKKELVVDERARASAANDISSLTDDLCRSAGIRHVDPNRIIEHQRLVSGWVGEGFDPDEHMRPAIRQAIADATERISSLRYFDQPIRQFRARQEATEHGHERKPRGGGSRTLNAVERAKTLYAERQAQAGGG